MDNAAMKRVIFARVMLASLLSHFWHTARASPVVFRFMNISMRRTIGFRMRFPFETM